MNPLEQVLNSYLELSPGWDGYGGVPATVGTVSDALAWLKSLPDCYFPPSPMIAGDGEISLYWQSEGFYLEVSFPGDKTCHFIATHGATRMGSDYLEVSVASQDPQFLIYYGLIPKQ